MRGDGGGRRTSNGGSIVAISEVSVGRGRGLSALGHPDYLVKRILLCNNC